MKTRELIDRLFEAGDFAKYLKDGNAIAEYITSMSSDEVDWR